MIAFAVVGVLAIASLAVPSTFALITGAPASSTSTVTVSNADCQNLVTYQDYLTTYLGASIYYPLTESPGANPLTIADAITPQLNASMPGTHGSNYFLAAPAGSGTMLGGGTCMTSRGVLLRGGTSMLTSSSLSTSATVPLGVGMWIRVDAAPSADVALLNWGGGPMLTLTPQMTLIRTAGEAVTGGPVSVVPGQWTYIDTFRDAASWTARAFTQNLSLVPGTATVAISGTSNTQLRVGPTSGANFEVMISDVSVSQTRKWTDDEIKDLITLTPPLSVDWPNTTWASTASVRIVPVVKGAKGTTTFSTSSALPPGLAMDPSTGIVSGTPGLRVSKVTVGNDHACAIAATSGLLYCWGNPALTANGNAPGNQTYLYDPAPVQGALLGQRVSDVSASWQNTCAIRASDQTLWCWGTFAGSDGTNLPQQITLGTATTFTQVVAASAMDVNPNGSGLFSSTICAIATSGDVYCFGANRYGVAGQAPVQGVPVPPQNAVPVKFSGDGQPIQAKQITVGDGYACAIRAADASMVCWGSQQYGQLGDGVTSDRFNRNPFSTTAVDVIWPGASPSTAVKSIAAGKTGVTNTGTQFTCAVKLDDTVWCWGQNVYGEVTNTLTASSNTVPRQIPFPTPPGTVTAVAGGVQGVCALGASATWCWGQNFNGRLGVQGTPGSDLQYPTTPRLMAGDFVTTGAAQISTSNSAGCGILAGGGGQLYCWGNTFTYKLFGNGLSTTSPNLASPYLPAKTGLLGTLPKTWTVTGTVQDVSATGTRTAQDTFTITLQ